VLLFLGFVFEMGRPPPQEYILIKTIINIADLINVFIYIDLGLEDLYI